jgi:hypothetical protein
MKRSPVGHLGQGKIMGELDNAKVSLYRSYYNFGLIIVCRIEEYAVMSPCL